MKHGRSTGILLAVGLALLPPLYSWSIWAKLPAQVPQHFTNGQADGFMFRNQLVGLAWVPALLYGLCTCVPQVQAARFSWWRSPHQRQLRVVVVAATSIAITASIYRITS